MNTQTIDQRQTENTNARQDSPDGMPYEVATSILMERKAKISNTFRKAAKRAREIVYSSATPLRNNHAADPKDRALYSTPPRPASPEGIRDPKLARCKLAQIIRWERRAKAKRAVVQREYVALGAKAELVSNTPRENAIYARKMGVLQIQATILEQVADSMADELAFRHRIESAIHNLRAERSFPTAESIFGEPTGKDLLAVLNSVR